MFVDNVNQLGLTLIVHSQYVFSPLSVFLLLLGIKMGARNKSLDELNSLLLGNKTPLDKKTQKYNCADSPKTWKTIPSPLHVASAVFHSIPIRSSYCKSVKRSLNMSTRPLDCESKLLSRVSQCTSNYLTFIVCIAYPLYSVFS